MDLSSYTVRSARLHLHLKIESTGLACRAMEYACDYNTSPILSQARVFNPPLHSLSLLQNERVAP